MNTKSKTPSNSASTRFFLNKTPFWLPNTGLRPSIFLGTKILRISGSPWCPRSVKGQLYTWGKGPATGFDGVDVITTPRQVGFRNPEGRKLEFENSAILAEKFHNFFYMDYIVMTCFWTRMSCHLQNKVSSLILHFATGSISPFLHGPSARWSWNLEIRFETRLLLGDFWIFQGSDSRDREISCSLRWRYGRDLLAWKLFMIVGKWLWSFQWAC